MNNSKERKPAFLERQSFAKEIMEYIKEQILNGELNSGDRIVETKLAKELGISQTPVREAIRQLQGEGIVHIVPNRGPIVCLLEQKDIFEVYSLRAAIEGLAIRLASLRATDEQLQELGQFYDTMKDKLNEESVEYLLDDSFYIHESIIRLSEHSHLITMYDSLSFKISLINRMLGTKKTKEREVEQHAELIDVLKQRNPDKAEETMRKHIYRSYREFLEMNAASETPDDFAKEELWI